MEAYKRELIKIMTTPQQLRELADKLEMKCDTSNYGDYLIANSIKINEDTEIQFLIDQSKIHNNSNTKELKDTNLISYYYSTDKDVTLARNMISELECSGINLNNENKNYIIKEIQKIYSSGAIYGQARMASIVKKYIEKLTIKPQKEFLIDFIAKLNKYNSI